MAGTAIESGPSPFSSESHAATETDMQDKCGIIAIRTQEPTLQFPALLEAAYGVQHRGQAGAGIAMWTREGYEAHIDDGLLRKIYTQEVIDRFIGIRTILGFKQLRYGTDGGYGRDNLQPFQTTHKRTGAKIVVEHNGQFTGISGIRRILAERGMHFPEDASDTRMFTELLADSEAESPDEIVLSTLGKVDGAYNLAIGIDDALYVARDKRGTHPLVLGSIDFPDTQGWIVASETYALSRVGKETSGIRAKPVREIMPGEVLKIDDNGIHQVREGEQGEGNFCDFETIYFTNPASRLPLYLSSDDGKYPERWKSVAMIREQVGRELAKRIRIEDASFVVGMPDSAVDIGLGYAFGAGVPYRQAIKKDHYGSSGELRTFQHDNEVDVQIRGRVLNKLLFLEEPEVWDGIVVAVDDSIVRGNVSRASTQMMFELGAREVHWVIAFPPVRFPCPLGISMRESQKSRLIADNTEDPREIAKAIGATSVSYILPEELLRAERGGRSVVVPDDPKDIFLVNGGCGGCVTGRYPIDREGVIWQRAEPVLAGIK